MKNNKDSFYDLITSESGIHVSIYLPRPSSSLQAKNLLNVALQKCVSQMSLTVDKYKIENILAPIKSISQNPNLLSGFKTNIGIFRNENFLRIVSVPIDTSFSTHVANTFHIKPLLDFASRDYRYILLGISGTTGFLYRGNSHDYSLIDEINFTQTTAFHNDPHYNRLKSKNKRNEYIYTIQIQKVIEQIVNLNDSTPHTIFTCMSSRYLHKMKKLLLDKNLHAINLSKKFNPRNEVAIHSDIHNLMVAFKETSFQKSAEMFSDLMNCPDMLYNIHEISIAARSGHIDKLMIASNSHIFGKIHQDGTTVLHQYDTDHEDDDLLDDIAQMVFKNGGEVLVVPQKNIPQGNIIMALLKNSERNNQQAKFRIFDTSA